MSMTEYFFSNQYAGQRELFEGLSIWNEEAYRGIQGAYPVIFMSFADIKGKTYHALRMGIIHKKVLIFIDEKHAFGKSEPERFYHGFVLGLIAEKNYDASLIARGIPKEHIHHYGFAFDGKKVLIG